MFGGVPSFMMVCSVDGTHVIPLVADENVILRCMLYVVMAVATVPR